MLHSIVDEVEQGAFENLPVSLDLTCLWAVDIVLDLHLVHLDVFKEGLHEVFQELLHGWLLDRAGSQLQLLALVLQLHDLALCHEAKSLTAIPDHGRMFFALLNRLRSREDALSHRENLI